MKTTAIPASRLQSPSGSRLAARLPDFVTLTKPRVMALAVFTALVEMIIAPGHLDPLLGSIAVLAIAAGAGAVGVLNMWCDNMWCDADIDAVMTRCPRVNADRRQAHHEPRAGQAPRRRPIVASAPR
jgi:heme o synthase